MAEALDFYERFNFVVEIDGIRRAGFMSASELAAEVGVVELREGGRGIPHKKPGLLTYPDITLTRGATDDRDLYDWFDEVASFTTSDGATGDAYKRDIDLVQIDRDGSERRRWTIFGAFCRRYKAGDWDATSEDAMMEEVVLAFDRFEIT